MQRMVDCSSGVQHLAERQRGLDASAPMQLQARLIGAAVQPLPAAVAQCSSKDSIEQPAAASAVVPDLTPELVTQIQAAGSKAARQAVLEALLEYLNAKGAVDDYEKTNVVYVHRANGNAGVTKVEGMDDDASVRITIYSNAFASAPMLYSVLRHELIHVGQRLQVPDEEGANMRDEFVHENIYDEMVGQLTRLSLQLPLQEVETHVWELDHADETGVDAAYQAETARELVRYVGQVVEAIGDETTVPDDAYEYWKGYIYRVKMMLDDCSCKDVDLADAREDLDDAIGNREQLILNNSVAEEDGGEGEGDE